jgi:uncharacterized protein YdiU (UPF0061 family)
MRLSYSYASELQALTSAVKAQPLYQQKLAMVNERLSDQLGISPHTWQPENWQALLFDEESEWQKNAVAQKYGGHQFGQWNPLLGDGRGQLLAEIIGLDGMRHDLHLKGAGATPYARHADGRAVLRSSLREYLASEAMYHLHIPTSNALCLFTSSEPVQRESIERGAMLIRTCPSHIRFGHFEYLFHSGQFEHLEALFNYCFIHHFQSLQKAENPHLGLFEKIVQSTAKLIAKWQAIGFNHGVMNTDNMSIHGITFDYGPFAFLDDYSPDFICNKSDQNGRYAFSQQPEVGLWNLNALAQAFTRHATISELTLALQQYQPMLTQYYYQLIGKKMGLNIPSNADESLRSSINDVRNRWFEILEHEQCDYSISFRLLAYANIEPSRILSLFKDQSRGKEWLRDYLVVTEHLQYDTAQLAEINPNIVLRNFHLQQAIEAAEHDDFSVAENLFCAVQNPFSDNVEFERFTHPAPAEHNITSLSCSS